MLNAEKIKAGMDADEWQEAWLALVHERGHILKSYDDEPGRIDMFVTATNGHNGPGCVKCGWTECMHCDWKGENIPVCTGEKEDPGAEFLSRCSWH